MDILEHDLEDVIFEDFVIEEDVPYILPNYSEIYAEITNVGYDLKEKSSLFYITANEFLRKAMDGNSYNHIIDNPNELDEDLEDTSPKFHITPKAMQNRSSGIYMYPRWFQIFP